MPAKPIDPVVETLLQIEEENGPTYARPARQLCTYCDVTDGSCSHMQRRNK